LLRDYKIAVYPRPGYDGGKLKKHPSVTVSDTPLMELSSTFIRKAIKERKNIQFFTPEKVLDFIDKKGLYLQDLQAFPKLVTLEKLSIFISPSSRRRPSR